jgi:hypothetical protein
MRERFEWTKEKGIVTKGKEQARERCLSQSFPARSRRDGGWVWIVRDNLWGRIGDPLLNADDST